MSQQFSECKEDVTRTVQLTTHQSTHLLLKLQSNHVATHLTGHPTFQTCTIVTGSFLWGQSRCGVDAGLPLHAEEASNSKFTFQTGVQQSCVNSLQKLHRQPLTLHCTLYRGEFPDKKLQQNYSSHSSPFADTNLFMLKQSSNHDDIYITSCHLYVTLVSIHSSIVDHAPNIHGSVVSICLQLLQCHRLQHYHLMSWRRWPEGIVSQVGCFCSQIRYSFPFYYLYILLRFYSV